MAEVEQLFFYFLRKGLWGEASMPDVAVDSECWGELFRLSCRQAVSGIVADGIASTDMRPAPGLWHEWVLHLLHIEMVNGDMARRGDWLVDMLASEGIKASVFKGVSVARWYPVPSHRSYGDIDMIVHVGWDKLNRVLLGNGIPYYYENDDIIVEQFGDIPAGNVECGGPSCRCDGLYRVEFHSEYEILYNPFMNMRLRRMASGSSSWWRDNMGCGRVPGETPEFYLACLILHMRRHVLSYGIGMKQVCDVAVMLSNAGVDIDRLRSMLRHLGAWRFSRALFRFIDAYLHDGVAQGGQAGTSRDTALLYSIFMRDGYVLKSERESIGCGTRHMPLRIIKNGWFWAKRSVRLFRLMPGEAFFFVFDKTVNRLKAMHRAINGRPVAVLRRT